MKNPAEEKSSPILLHQEYAESLRRHAIMLIWCGFRRLDAARFANAEEDDITGELVRVIKLVVQDPASPDWVDSYEIREQVRQNVRETHGKRRPIMDIEIERHHRGSRPCLGFEAKPLGRGKTIGGYVGEKGLRAFSCGYYPTSHGEAGMIGYVQEKACEEWSGRLAQEFLKKPQEHRVSDGGQLASYDAREDMPAFRSAHTDTNGNSLLVIHILLPFVLERQAA